jgi:hypothetical protein
MKLRSYRGLGRLAPASTKLRYDDGMKRPGFRRLLWLGKRAVLLIPDSALIEKIEKEEKEKGFPFKIIGLASVAVGAAALGLYLGREFRSRYKFNRRTPYDRFAHAGDKRAAVGEFGMGI